MIEPKKISYSEFKNWKECPYRHKLVYIDKLDYYSGNEYTAFGTAIHKVCEEIVLDNSVDPQTIFLNSLEEEISTLKGQDISINNSLLLEMKVQAPQIYNNLISSIKEYFGKYEVVSVEEPLLEKIEEFDSKGRNFKGFIDLVLKTEDGKYHIIDWKTCSWGWPAAKKTDKILNYQLTYYKNYFSKKHNVPLSNIETHFGLLKRTAKSKNVEIFRVTSGDKKIKNSLKILENAVINIEKNMFIKNRLSCKYCKFHKTENCK